MSEQPTPATSSETLQILITEHNNMQAVRSATVFEANGRTNLFLGAVSSSLIALAFIGQASDMGNAFHLFALILLPSLIFLGWVTFLRVNQTGIEDMMASRGISRIRHYYAEISPLAGNYFIFSAHDDVKSFFQNFGAPASFFQHFVATAGLVGVINSVLTAALVGLLTFSLFRASPAVCVITSVVVFAVSVALYARHQQYYFEENEKHIRVLFPSDNPQK